MNMKYRLAEKNNEDAILFCDLANLLYARKVNLAYYFWQFFSPLSKCFLNYAMTEDGRLAGCYGFRLNSLANGNIRLGMAIDNMIAPEYQKKGVFHKLADFALDNLMKHKPVAAYGITNAKAESAYCKGLGWKNINIYNNYVFKGTPGIECETKANFTKVISFSEQDIEFIEKANLALHSKGLLSIRRDMDWMRWRYFENPRYNYSIIRCISLNRLLGMLVLKDFIDPTTGKTTGDIVDIMYLDDDPNILHKMIRYAIRYFNSNYIFHTSTWLQTNTNIDQVGKNIGFSKTELKRYFCIKVFDENLEALMSPKKWFITMADSEVY